MADVILEVQHVSKSFGGVKALVDVNMKVFKNEFLAIIGPNGAGKTTLFNIITGLIKPDSGRILFEGVDITNLPSYKRAKLGIARSFQIPRLFMNSKVIDNVMVGAIYVGNMDIDKAKERAKHVLSLVGLEKKAEEYVVNLTSPEKKLLELARALATKPKLLLLDEIVAGLPPSEVDNLMRIVRKISIEEKINAIALVEHVMRAVRYADRAVFLYQGRIVVEGKPDDVLNSKIVKDVYFGEVIE
ncbi:ABC transporter ATP-binding protein [Thermogladius sp. 4427co]|uniref:ABC transporter ATP-binding protein n=1 Tax=Thermogladius sp. 4427co TaxID=3450718 RepID=UPI003F78DA63